ncbi:MAG: hypothetical protein KDE19_08355 [Caldilineaceae bacterium]|nr:hypothetical protein [Caldilineaceae bacterium]
MLETNIDNLLALTAQIAWLLFLIYAILVFIRTLRKHGLLIALVRLFSFPVLLPFLGAFAISMLSLAIVFVEPQQVAVVVSVPSAGGIRPQPMRAGLHLIIPLLEHEVRYPIYWQTYTMSSQVDEGDKLGDDSIRARTRDGQEVHLDTSVIFRIDQGQAVSVHIDWQNRYIEDFVRPVIRGEVRTQVSQFTVQEVNSSARKDLEATLQELLSAQFAEQGLLLNEFLLRDITFSAAYAAAIENKQVALEGEEQKMNEAQQLRNLAAGRRDQLRIEAQGEADAILLRSQAQADGLKLIADALAKDENLVTYHYVEKIAPNIRVMLLPSGNPLILPMPDLNEMIPLTGTVTPTMTVTATPNVGTQP